MALKELAAAAETLTEVAAELQSFDFDIPTEPADDAPADNWREYGLEVADKLAEAEKLARRLQDQIEGK